MDRAGTVLFAQAAWAAMTADAAARYPRECCGALMTAAGEAAEAVCVEAVIPLPNRSTDAMTRFLIDPEELLEATREARDAGLRVAGFYHSHPDKGAYFSESDAGECWPGYVNVVLSVAGGRFSEARAYRVDSGQGPPAELGLAVEGAD
jgi:proteasome lid subunit RPN8/RPN11